MKLKLVYYNKRLSALGPFLFWLTLVLMLFGIGIVEQLIMVSSFVEVSSGILFMLSAFLLFFLPSYSKFIIESSETLLIETGSVKVWQGGKISKEYFWNDIDQLIHSRMRYRGQNWYYLISFRGWGFSNGVNSIKLKMKNSPDIEFHYINENVNELNHNKRFLHSLPYKIVFKKSFPWIPIS